MGGSARSWSGTLQGKLAPRGLVRLRLVLTKFGPPAVRIRWTLRLAGGRAAAAARPGCVR